MDTPHKIRKGDRVLFEGRSAVVTSVTTITAGGPTAALDFGGGETGFARVADLVEDMRTGASWTPPF